MQLRWFRPYFRFAIAAALIAVSTVGAADPWAPPGDLRLRHDLQLLADSGLLAAPLTTWPVAFGDIAANLTVPDDPRALAPAVRTALARVQRRLRRESRTGVMNLGAMVSAAEEPIRLRSFADTPREDAEAAVRVSGMGRFFAWRLQATAVSDPLDDKTYRLDGSYLGVALGNWMFSYGQQPRWWGPGWDGSLILGTAARPVPALVLERNRSDAFDLPVLHLLGPWKLVAFLGELEQDRFVPDAKLFGMRVTVKPTAQLEVGASRTAQWGGQGRSEDFDTFLDMLTGNDNFTRETAGPGRENEPGNQLAGFDFRWQSPFLERKPFALYGQLIGEDQGGNWPSHHIGLAGIEQWGQVGGRSYRIYLEAANTHAQFYKERTQYDFAYTHHIYRDGYHYYDRPLGHAADGDSRVYSLGLILAGDGDRLWSLQLQRAALNTNGRDGRSPHSVSSNVRTDLDRILITHRRPLFGGDVDLGLGAVRLEADAETDTEVQAFLRWSVNWH